MDSWFLIRAAHHIRASAQSASVVSRVPAIRRRDHVISAVLTIDLQRLGARWAADLVVDASA
jgi:hypothetical protein